jgi:hypothetical protein
MRPYARRYRGDPKMKLIHDATSRRDSPSEIDTGAFLSQLYLPARQKETERQSDGERGGERERERGVLKPGGQSRKSRECSYGFFRFSSERNAPRRENRDP